MTRGRLLRRALGRVMVIMLSGMVTVALLLAGAEAYFRSVYPPSYDPDRGLTVDSQLGWDSVPKVSALPLNSQAPVAVHFLGDSFTDRKQWPAEAQRLLHERGLRVDGYNFGVSGFGTTQEFMKFAQHLDELRPDAVVLLFFAWNDLRDNYPFPELSYGPQRAARPYLVFADGRWSLTPVTVGAWLHSRLLNSEVYLRVWHRAARRFDRMVVERWPDLPARLRWRAKIYYEEAASWHAFYDPRQADSPYVTGAYETTMEAFRRIRDLAKAQGAPLLVIGIDNAFTVDSEVAQHYLAPFPNLDASLPLKRIERLLRNEGIPFINAQPALAALRAQTGNVVYDGPAGGRGLAGHLQPLGDRLVGRLAAEWLHDALSHRSGR